MSVRHTRFVSHRHGLLLAAGLALTACASDNEQATQRNAWVAEGPPVSCITTSQIRTMRIVNDQTIDFEMTGRRNFRNNLPFRCSGLSFNQSIRHNSRTSRLCRVDTFTVVSLGRGMNGPTCQLGSFQPMVRAPVPEAAPKE